MTTATSNTDTTNVTAVVYDRYNSCNTTITINGVSTMSTTAKCILAASECKRLQDTVPMFAKGVDYVTLAKYIIDDLHITDIFNLKHFKAPKRFYDAFKQYTYADVIASNQIYAIVLQSTIARLSDHFTTNLRKGSNNINDYTTDGITLFVKNMKFDKQHEQEIVKNVKTVPTVIRRSSKFNFEGVTPATPTVKIETKIEAIKADNQKLIIEIEREERIAEQEREIEELRESLKAMRLELIKNQAPAIEKKVAAKKAKK